MNECEFCGHVCPQGESMHRACARFQACLDEGMDYDEAEALYDADL